jgi:hypothetical protein
MKRLLLSAVAASATLALLPAVASAQDWQSINQRQANLDQRIDEGVRSGVLTRPEAITLRGEFNTLADLEAQYRRSGGGLDARERMDLDQRFDRLSQKIRVQRNDRDQRGDRWDDRGPPRGDGWQSINQRQANLDRRIDQGVANRSLTRREAASLRMEFDRLARLETQYRRSGGGLNSWERSDLDQRFDRLSQRIRWDRHDRQDRR